MKIYNVTEVKSFAGQASLIARSFKIITNTKRTPIDRSYNHPTNPILKSLDNLFTCFRCRNIYVLHIYLTLYWGVCFKEFNIYMLEEQKCTLACFSFLCYSVASHAYYEDCFKQARHTNYFRFCMGSMEATKQNYFTWFRWLSFILNANMKVLLWDVLKISKVC